MPGESNPCENQASRKISRKYCYKSERRARCSRTGRKEIRDWPASEDLRLLLMMVYFMNIITADFYGDLFHDGVKIICALTESTDPKTKVRLHARYNQHESGR